MCHVNHTDRNLSKSRYPSCKKKSKKTDTAGKKKCHKNPIQLVKKVHNSIFAKTPDTAAKIRVRPTSTEQKSVTHTMTILIDFVCKSVLGVKRQNDNKKK